MSERFQYSIVRYVPNVVRDEAVNVGVLVRAVDGTAFTFRFLPRASAVRKLWPGADQRLVRLFEKQLKNALNESPSLLPSTHPLVERFGNPRDADFLARARTEFTGNLQLTAPRGYIASNIDSAVKWAYSEYVEEPAVGSRPINYQSIAPFTLRTRVWSAFEKRNLIAPTRVERQRTLQGKHAPWTFDLTYHNGALNLINSIALDAPSLETNLGRALVFKGMIDDVIASSKDDVHAIAIAKTSNDPTHSPGSEQAEIILRDADVEIVDATQLSAFVERVEKELLAHSI
jgi:hypothetical protein